jgi:hypothetical protein
VDGGDERGGTGAGDRAAIAELVQIFFAAFVSGPELSRRLDAMREVLLPQAVIVRTCGGEPAVYDVESFIGPRRELLSSDRLTHFSEWEVSGRSELFGDIATHFCSYAKSGVQGGTPFTARGMKVFQFVRTGAGWRISAVAWDDERDGLTVDPAWGEAGA